MPLRYDIPIASDLVFVTGFGPVSLVDGATLARRVATDDRLAASFGMLVRLAEARVALDADRDTAVDAAETLRTRGLRRTAVVAADPAGYDLGRAFATRAADYGLAVRVFSDDLEAVSWLLGVE